MSAFKQSIERQIINSYGISYKKSVLSGISNTDSGLDNFKGVQIPQFEDIQVTVNVNVNIRPIADASHVADDEHLIQILDDSNSKVNGTYGRGEIGGKNVYLNAKYIPNMIGNNDENTVPHELGHTAGLRHIDKEYESFWDLFGGNSQFYNPTKQKANSFNIMFSGSSPYMNDKTSTQINREQIETIKAKYNSGGLNQG